MNDSDRGTDARRRIVLGSLGAGLVAVAPLAGASLLVTPRQSEGPFYPRDLPLDRDADLVRVEGRQRPAAGVVTHVHGRVLDPDGAPLDGARVEIWQCDANGRYLHPGDRGRRPRDPGFQGFGQALSDRNGRYRFRTIRPVPYPGRAPHIHFRIVRDGLPELITQMYVAGAPENERDVLLRRVRDPAARAALTVRLLPHAGRPGELEGRFDIVLGA